MWRSCCLTATHFAPQTLSVRGGQGLAPDNYSGSPAFRRPSVNLSKSSDRRSGISLSTGRYGSRERDRGPGHQAARVLRLATTVAERDRAGRDRTQPHRVASLGTVTNGNFRKLGSEPRPLGGIAGIVQCSRAKTLRVLAQASVHTGALRPWNRLKRQLWEAGRLDSR